MLKALVISAVLVLVIAVLVAGCGDDGDANAGSIETSSLSKPQYIKQADQGCTDERQAAERQFFAYSKQAGADDPAGNFETATRRIFAPSLKRQAEVIRTLGAPSGDEQQIEALLNEMERASAALAADPPSAVSGYTAELKRASLMAARYGLTECASSTLV